MPTSLRTFEDWHTPGDDQIRSGFPAMALSADEIAKLDADPLTRYERAAHALEQARAEFTTAAAALRTHQKAQRDEARQLREQSQAEQERRLAAPLNGNQGWSLLK